MSKSKTKLYRRWASMKHRCTNPNNTHYDRYGGRGITVCDAWMESFEQFKADMGDFPEGGTLDRIDNDGDYTPENCRWATRKVQAENKSNNIRITFQGQTLTLSQWADRTGIGHETLRIRYHRGWSARKIVTTIPGSSVTLTYRGITKTCYAWAKKVGLHHSTLLFRIESLGWTVEDALLTPARKRKKSS